jgi:hypothetical protein
MQADIDWSSGKFWTKGSPFLERLRMQKDEAGPLWIMFENFMDSWPVKPKWVLLAMVIAVAVFWLIAALSKRDKSR